MCGGQVRAFNVEFDDGGGEWRGATDAPDLPNHSEQAEMLLAGGFAECRFVANVYDSLDWTINEAVSRPALVAIFAAHVPGQLLTVTFDEPNNPPKTFQFEPDTFSNDWHKAEALVQQHHLSMNNIITNSINRINNPAFWQEVIQVARCFLMRPPRILIWQYGYDQRIDPHKRQYMIGPIEDRLRKKLGVQVDQQP